MLVIACRWIVCNELLYSVTNWKHFFSQCPAINVFWRSFWNMHVVESFAYTLSTTLYYPTMYLYFQKLFLFSIHVRFFLITSCAVKCKLLLSTAHLRMKDANGKGKSETWRWLTRFNIIMSPITVQFKIWEYYHNKASVVLVMYREKKLNREQKQLLISCVWLFLEQRLSNKLLTRSVFKSLSNLYSEGLKNIFKPTSRIHSYNVWGALNNVFVPRPCTEAAMWAFSFRGAVMWNGLENELKDKINLNSFNSALTLSWTRDCFEGVGGLIFVYLILG